MVHFHQRLPWMNSERTWTFFNHSLNLTMIVMGSWEWNDTTSICFRFFDLLSNFQDFWAWFSFRQFLCFPAANTFQKNIILHQYICLREPCKDMIPYFVRCLDLNDASRQIHCRASSQNFLAPQTSQKTRILGKVAALQRFGPSIFNKNFQMAFKIGRAHVWTPVTL